MRRAVSRCTTGCHGAPEQPDRGRQRLGDPPRGPAGADHPPVQHQLDRLHQPHRQLAPPLHPRERALGHHQATAQVGREQVGRGDGVLHGVVDPHPEGRRHGVRGVPDAQQPRAVPPLEPVDLHRQQLDLVEGLQGADDVPQDRRGPHQPGPQRRQALGADPVQGALGDQHPALVVVAPVDGEDQVAAGEVGEGGWRRRRRLGQAEPQHVDRHPELAHRHVGQGADPRGAAVGGDGEVGGHLQHPVGGPGRDAPDPAALPAQAGHLRLHHQVEGRVPPRLGGEEVQEVPLRHQPEERARPRQGGEVDRGEPVPRHDHVQPADLVLQQRPEPVEQPELAEHLQRRGVDRVAAEVAQEVAVLLQHHDVDTGPCQQVAEHHPGRSATRDDAAGGQGRRRGRHVSSEGASAPAY